MRSPQVLCANTRKKCDLASFAMKASQELRSRFFVGDGARAGVSCKTCEKASKICDETRAQNRRFCRGTGKTCSEIYVSSLLWGKIRLYMVGFGPILPWVLLPSSFQFFWRVSTTGIVAPLDNLHKSAAKITKK